MRVPSASSDGRRISASVSGLRTCPESSAICHLVKSIAVYIPNRR